MTNRRETVSDDIVYDHIVYICDRCDCEVIIDVDSLPAIEDGGAGNAVETSYCPECGEALPKLRRKAVEQ